MTIEGLLDLVHTRRSVRGFDPQHDVPDKLLEQIIEAAHWAPSGGNGQPWHFLIIRNQADRDWSADLFEKQQEPDSRLLTDAP